MGPSRGKWESQWTWRFILISLLPEFLGTHRNGWRYSRGGWCQWTHSANMVRREIILTFREERLQPEICLCLGDIIKENDQVVTVSRECLRMKLLTLHLSQCSKGRDSGEGEWRCQDPSYACWQVDKPHCQPSETILPVPGNGHTCWGPQDPEWERGWATCSRPAEM